MDLEVPPASHFFQVFLCLQNRYHWNRITDYLAVGLQLAYISGKACQEYLRISSGIGYWNSIKMLAGMFFHTGLGLGFLEEDSDSDLDLPT